MQQQQNTVLGTLCVVFGLFLFFAVSNFLLFQLLIAYIAYKIVDFGLAMCGMPPVSFYLKSWLHKQGF